MRKLAERLWPLRIDKESFWGDFIDSVFWNQITIPLHNHQSNSSYQNQTQSNRGPNGSLFRFDWREIRNSHVETLCPKGVIHKE